MIMCLMVKAKHEKNSLLRLFAHYLAKLHKTGAIMLLDSSQVLGTNGGIGQGSIRKVHPYRKIQPRYSPLL